MKGVVSTELGIPGIPGAAEGSHGGSKPRPRRVDRCPTYILAHLEHMQDRFDLTREAKAQAALHVTAEVCPHHFTLTEEATRTYDSNAKMNPPLRTTEDVEACKTRHYGMAPLMPLPPTMPLMRIQDKQLEFDAGTLWNCWIRDSVAPDL